MAEKLAIMCVHGINHGDADAKLAPSWTKAISDNIRRWKPDAELTFEFLAYDDLIRTRAAERGDRALAWDPALGMWRERDMPKANRSLSASQAGAAYVGARGDTYRLGRGVSLRGLRDRVYDREREALRNKGSYMPVLMEACQEDQLSYEYRDGATSQPLKSRV